MYIPVTILLSKISFGSLVCNLHSTIWRELIIRKGAIHLLLHHWVRF